MRHTVTGFLFCSLASVSLAPAAATAQCAFSSLSLTSVGPGCATVFTPPPALSGGLEASTCSLDLTISAFGGCCNTFLTGRVLALGLGQNNLPLPMVGPGCTLWVQPDAVVFLPATAGDTVTLQLPPGLQPPLSFYAQGAALYFTTIGLANDAQLTGGHTVSVQ